ncbi:MAG: hypothetical protein WAW17_14200 [Rhodococcus sp. (in: high G+C Gram-positive bacteria)]|uniref:hypothetical protein n=1 Tax=Rhodococcus sp. TaxID=1831 RepID=UPI003BB146B4
MNSTLLTAIGVLMLAAFGSVACGLFSNGIGTKATMCGILAMVVLETVLVGLVLAAALISGLEEPSPEAEPYELPDEFV